MKYYFSLSVGPGVPGPWNCTIHGANQCISEKEILNKIKIKTVKYVDEILSETLENKIEPLIDIKPEIGQKIKSDQIEPSTQTH